MSEEKNTPESQPPQHPDIIAPLKNPFEMEIGDDDHLRQGTGLQQSLQSHCPQQNNDSPESSQDNDSFGQNAGQQSNAWPPQYDGMNHYYSHLQTPSYDPFQDPSVPVVLPGPLNPPQPVLNWKKPLLFYILTWISTTLIGALLYGGGGLLSGFWFSVPLMTILTCHELGHYVQTRRYNVPATLPFFIPLPLPPFGTMGAIIKMDSRIPNLRALFDIGISGPLAGLVPTLIFLLIGISLSSVQPMPESHANGIIFGEPLLFRWVSRLFFDLSDPNTCLIAHPIAMAAWTGLFITCLNLFPLGQLDGGHVFYSLLTRKAAPISYALFLLLALVIILTKQWNWSLMMILVLVFGVDHPPTCDDTVSLGTFRKVLGTLTLAFLLIGFTPTPIEDVPSSSNEEKEQQETPVQEKGSSHLAGMLFNGTVQAAETVEAGPFRSVLFGDSSFGDSAELIYNGKIWRLSRETGTVTVLDATTRKPLWSQDGLIYRLEDSQKPKEQSHRSKPVPMGPVELDGRIYMSFQTRTGCRLLSFDPNAEGRLVWTLNLANATFTALNETNEATDDQLLITIYYPTGKTEKIRIDAATGQKNE